MVTWKFKNVDNNTPFLAAYVYGEEFDFKMTFSNDGGLISHSTFFVEPEYAGMVGMRLEEDEDWRPLMAFPDACAHFGSMPAGDTEIQILLLNDSEPNRTFFVIPVSMVCDEMVLEPARAWLTTYGSGPWAHCYAKQVYWKQGYFTAESACSFVKSSGSGFTDTLYQMWLPSTNTPAMWGA